MKKKQALLLLSSTIKPTFVMLKKILAVVAQLVEHRLPKPRVTGSSPAYRSFPINLF
jgi:hypothetical protein